MEILFVAIALAMDAFAVSVSIGLSLNFVPLNTAFRTSFHFGLYQFFMPLIGWYTASKFSSYIQELDHWIAFLLLAGIGGKMILEAFEKKEGSTVDRTRGFPLILLSIATSIDAFAVGMAYSFLESKILFPAMIIGIIAFCLSYIGIKGGARFSKHLGNSAEIIGGIVLIFVGAKILVEHLSG